MEGRIDVLWMQGGRVCGLSLEKHVLALPRSVRMNMWEPALGSWVYGLGLWWIE